MRFRSLCTAAATALVIAVGSSSTASADINLPTGNCGTGPTNNCLIFDDFTVYSLAVLSAQQGYGPIGQGGPGNPYDIGTTGTDLHNVIVVATGITGTGSNNTDLITNGGVDNAYATPSNAGPGISNFQPQAGLPNVGNEGAQGTAIADNSHTTWDINTADLIDYLAGGKMAFFFNLNQANSANTYLPSAQDALGWLSVTLTNSTLFESEGAVACASDVNCSRTFYLDGNACDAVFDPLSPKCDASQAYAETNANNSILPNDPNHDEWAYVHGAICMSPQGAIVSFGPCAAGDHTDTTVNQNLSQNHAAFALYSDMLQYWLTHGDYDKMSVDLRMAALTNGYEQLVIFAALNIPEPITMTMFATGLLGLAAFAGLRRRKLKMA